MSSELELGTEPMILQMVTQAFKLRYPEFDNPEGEAKALIDVLKIGKLEICHFPSGRASPDDEGAVKIAVGVEDNVLKIKFGKEIAWMGFDKPEARKFIETFRFHMGKLK